MKQGHAEWRVAMDHPAAAGHFPANPIIPGAVLLAEIAAAIAASQPGMICRHVVSAKFLHPVRPGDALSITWEGAANGDIRFACGLAPAGPQAVTGALRLGPP